MSDERRRVHPHQLAGMDPKRQGDESLTGEDSERVRLHTEYCRQLDSRRAAEHRLPPLDVLPVEPSSRQLTQTELLAWRHAVAHLAEHDLRGVVPSQVGQALGLRRRWWAA